jgi:hypothetical protein
MITLFSCVVWKFSSVSLWCQMLSGNQFFEIRGNSIKPLIVNATLGTQVVQHASKSLCGQWHSLTQWYQCITIMWDGLFWSGTRAKSNSQTITSDTVLVSWRGELNNDPATSNQETFSEHLRWFYLFINLFDGTGVELKCGTTKAMPPVPSEVIIAQLDFN